MSSNFFAYISRMKLIKRWGLMRNTQPENDMEHSMQVVMLAHGMGVIANRRFGASVDLGKIALIAAYHDASEVITGDMATPIKYFSPDIRRAYGEIEQMACSRLTAMLPEAVAEALRLASAASSLAVAKKGASSSIPTSEEVRAARLPRSK